MGAGPHQTACMWSPTNCTPAPPEAGHRASRSPRPGGSSGAPSATLHVLSSEHKHYNGAWSEPHPARAGRPAPPSPGPTNTVVAINRQFLPSPRRLADELHHHGPHRALPSLTAPHQTRVRHPGHERIACSLQHCWWPESNAPWLAATAVLARRHANPIRASRFAPARPRVRVAPTTADRGRARATR